MTRELYYKKRLMDNMINVINLLNAIAADKNIKLKDTDIDIADMKIKVTKLAKDHWTIELTYDYDSYHDIQL